jgi:hypothetical protein
MLALLVRMGCKGLSIPLLATLCCGCQATQLQQRSVNMAGRLSELQYGQVMNNLALMADSPYALPHFVLTQQGRCGLEYADQSTVSLNWDRIAAASAGALLGLFRLDKESGTTTASAVDITEWDTTPDLDPVQEILMQGLYRKVLACDIPDYQMTALNSFFYAKHEIDDTTKEHILSCLAGPLATPVGPPLHGVDPKAKALATKMQDALSGYQWEYSAAMNEVFLSLDSGWVHVGCKSDVPRDACYVGKHKHTYVWVMPDDISHLTNLTIAILAIANSDLSVQSGRSTRAVGLSQLVAPSSVIGQP